MGHSLEADARASRIEEVLGYRFRDRALLRQALTHRSYSHEESEELNNEPLEFLGDAVLGFLVAERLVRRRPDLREGDMTRLRASLVNARFLARWGRELGLGEALMLGRGEEQSGGRAKVSLLADGVEALIGAVFLDGGIRPVRSLVWKTLGPEIDGSDPRRSGGRDPKTSLQEYLQGRGLPLPDYTVLTSDGPDHARTFRVAVEVRGERIAVGSGTAKKRAEQEAARRALAALRRGAVERSAGDRP